MTKSKNWGGVRPGAGHPRSMKPPLKKTAVTLEEWMVEVLRTYGNGSVSAGIRRMCTDRWIPKGIATSKGIVHLQEITPETQNPR